MEWRRGWHRESIHAAGEVVASGVMVEYACYDGKEDGATLKGRRENRFGREEAQALGEDPSKINEQPQGLTEGSEGPGSSFPGAGVWGLLGTLEAPSSSQPSPSPCLRGLRLHSELQALGLVRPNGGRKYLPC